VQEQQAFAAQIFGGTLEIRTASSSGDSNKWLPWLIGSIAAVGLLAAVAAACMIFRARNQNVRHENVRMHPEHDVTKCIRNSDVAAFKEGPDRRDRDKGTSLEERACSPSWVRLSFSKWVGGK
jgi:hypothetical protein